MKIAKARRQKKLDREHKQRKREYYDNDIGHWKKKARSACHKYIRYRDSHQPCISCGRVHANQWDAGHFRTRGAMPELQFHEWNINRQCARCNHHASGNDIDYEGGLVARIGREAVEFLKGAHQHHKWTLDDYKDVYWWYTQKLKWLRAEREMTTI